MASMYKTAYDFHKHLINIYVLNKKGATKLMKRDESRDKRDADVIRENHKFLWDETDEPQTWEERLAKKYYDKLFKEFCITDLSRYKENKFAMRWQTEAELISGKGQFSCSNKRCSVNDQLRTWEVNFAYVEHGEKKNALVKLRLCDKCSSKLNYRHKKKEIKRLPSSQIQLPKQTPSQASSDLPAPSDTDDIGSTDGDVTPSTASATDTGEPSSDIWSKPIVIEEPSRDEEFEKYLEQLLL